VKVDFLNPMGNVGLFDTRGDSSGERMSAEDVYVSKSSVFVRKSLRRSKDTFPVREHLSIPSIVEIASLKTRRTPRRVSEEILNIPELTSQPIEDGER